MGQTTKGPTRRLFRWQGITLATLFVGYSGYYVCRSNLSVVAPLMVDDPALGGITKTDIGQIASLGVFLYALGKVSNGVLTDFVGGRALFLGGMFASIACTILFGLAGGVIAFALIWAVNRYVQSMGWGALVKIAGHWFPHGWHSTVLGALSMSYLLGDAVARVYLGAYIQAGFSWRHIFSVSAVTLGLIAVAGLFTLKSSPRDIGEQEPAANPANLFGTGGDKGQPPSLGALLWPLLSSMTFWLVCVLNVGLTLIRETLTFWMPTYLHEVAGLDSGAAAQASMLFPLVGGASALLAGLIADRLQGRHGRVMVPTLGALAGALWLLGDSAVPGQPAVALTLVSLVACFLLPPYSFCSGVIPLALGGKQGSSTAAGLIDSAGYLGAVFSGVGVGWIAQKYGWSPVFHLLAGVAGLTLLASLCYWFVQEYGSWREEYP